MGQNIIVRVANNERLDNPDEDYFVAKIEEKAIKLEEGGTYSAVYYKKNDWLVYMHWYNFVPSRKNRNNDRFYNKGDVQWIPCGSIIQSLKEAVVLKWTGGHYRLSQLPSKNIEDYGDITY